MAKYSFKSVGTISSDTRFSDAVDNYTLPPIGIKTPLTLSDDGFSTLFNMHYELEEQIHDNLRNLIMTNPGERLGRYDFGAGLRALTMELSGNSEYEQIVMTNIKSAVAKYMPFVSLETFGVDKIKFDNTDAPAGMTKVTITIEYTVEKLKRNNRALELILYTAG